MPHAGKGTQHACPGATGPVTLPNGNVIPQGGCRWARDPRYCYVHNYICHKHEWIYSKKDTCHGCDADREAKKPENRKRKGDDDDDENEEKPAPKRITKKDGKKGFKAAMKSTRKTTTKEKSSKNKKEDTKQALVGLALGDVDSHWQFWMSGKKTIDLDQLVKDLTRVSPAQGSEDFFDGLTERASSALQIILPYLSDDNGMTVFQSLQATFEQGGQVSYEAYKDFDDEEILPTQNRTRSGRVRVK